MNHRWPKQGNTISPQKTERECLNNCGIIKVTRHETEGGRDKHWVEFYRGLDRIDDNGKTPKCIGRPTNTATYDARNYPL